MTTVTQIQGCCNCGRTMGADGTMAGERLKGGNLYRHLYEQAAQGADFGRLCRECLLAEMESVMTRRDNRGALL